MSTDLENPAAPTQLEAWSVTDVMIITAGAILVFVVGLVALYQFSGISQSDLQTTGGSILISAGLAALEGIAFIGSVYFLGLRRRKLSWAAVGLNPIPRGWLLISLIISLLVIPLSGLIAIIVQLLLGRPLENPQLPFLAPEGFSWFGFISMVLLGGLVAPFAEELFFRGVLYQWLRFRFGVAIGLIFSSIVFGALHGEISVAVAAAFLGVILAWAYERSRSLWSPFLIHAINNSFKIILLYVALASGLQIPGT
jgi:membrane protease YdiL (CAAX protease family)